MTQWLLGQIRKNIINIHLWIVRNLCGEVPIRLSYWASLRSVAGIIFRRPDPLVRPSGSLQTFGKALAIPELRQLLWDDVLGEWALDAHSIVVIWQLLWRDNPQMILELGAGISTLVLTTYAEMAASHGNSCQVVTLEQDQRIKAEVEDRLKSSRLDSFVKIIHSPLNAQGLYDLNELSALLSSSGRRVDWVLIDGPLGPPGCRFGTLPSLAKFCHRRARWFLDDAFRDAELNILKRWQLMPNITIDGIFPLGKGLATGHV